MNYVVKGTREQGNEIYRGTLGEGGKGDHTEMREERREGKQVSKFKKGAGEKKGNFLFRDSESSVDCTGKASRFTWNTLFACVTHTPGGELTAVCNHWETSYRYRYDFMIDMILISDKTYRFCA